MNFGTGGGDDGRVLRGRGEGEGVTKPTQPALFDIDPPQKGWEEHWRGMPEFVQARQRPYAQIMVRFRNQRDLDDFCRLIGQRLNPNSQCTWHPELPPIGRGPQERWVDEP